ncbi:putative RNA helicase [Rhizoctonia solani 123E]|uniref:RNA helicase n=1 Tax=Rhizoctonia solani 123E TaxID=1423351 RepID=A0A074SRB0_9AGAM|nr:putative RNA helicase [Rhizoctonia solani 123E]
MSICPSLLSKGFCLNNTCRLRHDTSNFCMTCNVALNTAAEYNDHVKTDAHMEASDTPQWLQCELCDFYYRRGTREQTSHENSEGHMRLMADRPIGADLPIVEVDSPPNWTTCDACKRKFPSWDADAHYQGSEHLKRQRIFDYQNALLRSQGNQRGIEIGGSVDGVDLGIHSPNSGTENTPNTVWIRCVGESPVSLMQARTSSSVGTRRIQGQSCFSVTTNTLPIAITPQASLAAKVYFNPRGQRGQFEDRLEFVFRDQAGTFVITRPVMAIAGTDDLVALAPTAPYQRMRRARERDIDQEIIDIERGENVIAGPRVEYRRYLKAEDIPEDMRKLVERGRVEDQVRRFGEQFLPETFDMDNFQQYWSSLVHAEHIQAENDLKEFDMDDVTLQQTNNSYRLTVPGLSEKRPSVIVGDRIKVHPHSEPEKVWYQGIVRDIETTTVLVIFNRRFPHSPTALYDVQFVLNPVPFKRMLQALAIDPKRREVLFPQVEDVTTSSMAAQRLEETEMDLYNRIIGTNEEQRNAIARVIHLPPGSPPYIIFGPPGTGKTVTAVECISQLLNDDNVRILACAPSNSASDLLAQRLIQLRGLNPSELVRLNALWRPRITLPEDLVEYSLISPTGGTFRTPKLEQLKSYRVVVATCSTAGLLYGLGVDAGTYSHIFIDEAGQGSEPEVMIPILTMAGPNTNIVLSGDPKQLGPVVRSPVARSLGMNVSYLDRLMASPAYDELNMRGISVTKLLQNFRSHESIISFPNEEFYRNELVAHAPRDVADSLLNWGGLVSQGFPIVFEAVRGENMQEEKSPSYFNPHEASLVKEYVQGLIPFIATPRNIGIVTPYKAQVRKIRKLLKDNGVTNIDIGSVEQFQGQERQVIIVSTVRSNKDLLSFDLKHTLGFVSNPKRLNVAITRAQSLLVVIGDPLVLGLDSLWRRFLYFVYRSGGWKGAPFPWDSEADPDDEPEVFDAAEQDLRELLRRATEAGSPSELDPVGGDE